MRSPLASRRLHARIEVNQTIDLHEVQNAPYQLRRNHQAQLGAAVGAALVPATDF
jgi:hypothetical protein